MFSCSLLDSDPSIGAGWDGAMSAAGAMGPASVNDQVRQAICAAGGLAVHLEASFGLGCGGCGCALLKACAFGARGEASNVSFDDGSEAEHQKGRKQDCEETTHRNNSCWLLPLRGEDVTYEQ